MMVTGVGSVPFAEMGPALDFVFQTCPEFPYLPQLGGGMVARGLEGVGELPRAFLERVQRLGPVGVKVQLAGPVTLAACSERRQFDLAEGVLAVVRGWQRQLGSGVLLVLDEPSLSPQNAMSLAPLISALRVPGWRVGLHTCGPPPMAELQRLGLDALSVDTASYGRAFSQAGGFEGLTLWGAVPVVPGDEGRVGQGLLTPSCGLGLCTLRRARQVMARCAELAAG